MTMCHSVSVVSCLLWSLVSAPDLVVAQASATVPVNTPFQIALDHDGQNVTAFRLERNGAVEQTKPAAGFTGGTVTFDVAGLSAGVYPFGVRAVAVYPVGQREFMGEAFSRTAVAGQPLVIDWHVHETPLPATARYVEFRLYEVGGVVLQRMPGAGLAPGSTQTWTVTGLPAGSVAFQIASFVEYTAPTESASPASLITITAAAQTPAQTVTVTPTAAVQGQALAVQWTCSSGCGAKDWLGMFPKGVTGNGGDIQWPGSYTNGAASGSYSTFKAPNAVGAYEIRYCRHTTVSPNGYDCAVAAPFTVSASTVPVDCVVSVWGEWSAWGPISATQEQRTRTRTVVTPAANGGKPCPPLTETETRLIQTPPPVTKVECTYALTFTVTTQNNVATVSTPVLTGGCK